MKLHLEYNVIEWSLCVIIDGSQQPLKVLKLDHLELLGNTKEKQLLRQKRNNKRCESPFLK